MRDIGVARTMAGMTRRGTPCINDASGVREKPPRGGRRGDLEEEPVYGPISERKQRVKPERRLSGGVFEGLQGRSGPSRRVITGRDPGYRRGFWRACGEG
ncbi:MAG: hypothetical protein OXI59_17495 [Gemmatimonadota bacterium]|nr:hypothetical protein [Gemmatimonadota bacterium]